MRRFEVWQLSKKDRTGEPRLVMVLQSEKIDHLSAIIVAPLRRESGDMRIPSLTPSIDVNGISYVVLVPFLAAISRQEFDTQVGNATELSYEITKALDRLFSGI